MPQFTVSSQGEGAAHGACGRGGRSPIAEDRRPGSFFEVIREAVSDRGGGVRGRDDAAHEGRRRRGRGTAIMKLTTMTQVTLDGVMQGDGAASEEDRRNGFQRGGWAQTTLSRHHRR
jgi:hypothetical protein